MEKVPVVRTRIVGDGLAPCRVHEPRGAVDNRFRADALLDGGGQRERLERRARLAPRRARCEVELAVRPILPADHGEHVAGVRVDARHRKAHVAIAGPRHIVVHFRCRFLRVALKRRVDRGVDRKPAVEHLLERKLVKELLAHVAREIRGTRRCRLRRVFRRLRQAPPRWRYRVPPALIVPCVSMRSSTTLRRFVQFSG